MTNQDAIHVAGKIDFRSCPGLGIDGRHMIGKGDRGKHRLDNIDAFVMGGLEIAKQGSCVECRCAGAVLRPRFDLAISEKCKMIMVDPLEQIAQFGIRIRAFDFADAAIHVVLDGQPVFDRCPDLLYDVKQGVLDGLMFIVRRVLDRAMNVGFNARTQLRVGLMTLAERPGLVVPATRDREERMEKSLGSLEDGIQLHQQGTDEKRHVVDNQQDHRVLGIAVRRSFRLLVVGLDDDLAGLPDSPALPVTKSDLMKFECPRLVVILSRQAMVVMPQIVGLTVLQRIAELVLEGLQK